MSLITQAASLLLSKLPALVSGIMDLIDHYQKQQRISRENKRREQIDKALQSETAEDERKVLADTLSNIRRNLSE